jgi:hypothetical protein
LGKPASDLIKHMTSDFKPYHFEKFPIRFLVPASARYREYTHKKYTRQVTFRETKDKYRVIRPGKIGFVFPKLSVSVGRTYVPAYQTRDRAAYFMPFEGYLAKLVRLDHMKTAFPDMVLDDVWAGEAWKGLNATFRHPSDTFWRSQVYLHEVEDDTMLVNILYRHQGTEPSWGELAAILDSFEPNPIE